MGMWLSRGVILLVAGIAVMVSGCILEEASLGNDPKVYRVGNRIASFPEEDFITIISGWIRFELDGNRDSIIFNLTLIYEGKTETEENAVRYLENAAEMLFVITIIIGTG